MSPSYAETIFRATHNSYSGQDRRSVRHQLERGVRVLELDVISPEYERYGYRVGHGLPGIGVVEGEGNPLDDRLTSWLEVVGEWADAHPSSAPVTIIVDPKSDPRGGLAHPGCAAWADHLRPQRQLEVA